MLGQPLAIRLDSHWINLSGGLFQNIPGRLRVSRVLKVGGYPDEGKKGASPRTVPVLLRVREGAFLLEALAIHIQAHPEKQRGSTAGS